MGWLHDSAPGHEGYVVALVEQDMPSGWPRWRELGTGDGPEPPPHIRAIQVACDCGWRSPRFFAPPLAEWMPYTVLLYDDDLEEEARLLWQHHAEAEITAPFSRRRLSPLRT